MYNDVSQSNIAALLNECDMAAGSSLSTYMLSLISVSTEQYAKNLSEGLDFLAFLTLLLIGVLGLAFIFIGIPMIAGGKVLETLISYA